MATARLIRISVQEHIYRALREEIETGRLQPGARLPSVEALADRFIASRFPVQKAVHLLARDGYVEVRHGSGTTVLRQTGANVAAAALCMRPRGHWYGEFCDLLMRELNARELVPVLAEANLPSIGALPLRRPGLKPVMLLVHGTEFVSYSTLENPALTGIPVIGLLSWCSPNLPSSLVLLDDDAVGVLAADALWARGHRRTLLLITEPRHAGLAGEIAFPPNRSGRSGVSFMRAWRERGGSVEPLVTGCSLEGQIAPLSPELMAPHFGVPGKCPTAIFGTQDSEVLRVQRTAAKHWPDAAAKIDYLGCYDTPWSAAGDPPFSSIAFDLQELSRAVGQAVESVRAGRPFSEVRVQPNLVARWG